MDAHECKQPRERMLSENDRSRPCFFRFPLDTERAGGQGHFIERVQRGGATSVASSPRTAASAVWMLSGGRVYNPVLFSVATLK
mmetsp:Transcript_25622/g.50143  ORF Transcript_25622/g.50143 Transcript_25622/m.50143 type:complete len:84 (+) Transcript_25622:781-1032(+)